MKLSICLGKLENVGELPRQEDMRKDYRHDLIRLKDAVVDLGKSTGYFDSRPAASKDLQFIAEDELLNLILSMLSEFNGPGRYYDLDVLLRSTAATSRGTDPKDQFDAINHRILDSHPEWKDRIGIADFVGFYAVRNAVLTATLQRFARALCRFFTLGPLGQQGQRLLGVVKVFLFLRDEQLCTVPVRWYER